MPEHRWGTSTQRRHEEFAGQIIAMLEKGLAPWQRDWEAGTLFPPFNPVSGTVYSGVNRLMLSKPDYADPRWMTSRQAHGEGYWIRKGAKSRPIVHWQCTKTVDRLDGDGRPVLGADGRPEKKTVRLERPLIRFFSVFHAGQIETEDGQTLPPYEAKEMGWRPHERAEALLQASGADIVHDQRDRAFYNLHADEIHLPPKENFSDEGRYYPTALHELGHWTRHPSRLNRESGPFGSEMYAREELTAHIASWMLSQDLGIAFNADHHASYLQAWLKALKDDPNEIFRACGDAERVRQYILGLEQKQEQASGITAPGPEENPWARKWYDNLRRPEDFIYLYHQWRDLGPDAGSEETDKLRQVYGNYTRRISETVVDKLEDPDTRERRRERLANLLLETHMLHGKMVELGFLPPEARFQHQELAEGILEREARELPAGGEKEAAVPAAPAREKVYLAVAYKDKNEAKRAGAKWDGAKKRWYAPVDADLNKLAGFLPEKEPLPAPAVSPVEEFRRLLEGEGFILKGDPVMDGKIHRVPVEGKPGQRDGAYQAYADGHPNGWFQNHRAGNVQKWLYSGHTCTDEQIRAWRAKTAEQQLERRKELEKQHEDAVSRIFNKLASNNCRQADGDHPYLQAKGVKSHGLFQDQAGNLMLVGIDLDHSHFLNNHVTATNDPPRSANDLSLHHRIQTLQTIGPDGQKRYEPGSKKSGAMFLIGDRQLCQIVFDRRRPPMPLLQDLEPKPLILVAEGYATAASLYQATGLPVAAAFDAGNLMAVSEALQRKFPEAGLVVCADHDHAGKHNVGLQKAYETARATGAKVIFPQFTDEEKAAGLTDFNDLAQARGLAAAAEHVSSLLLRFGPAKAKSQDQAAAPSLSL